IARGAGGGVPRDKVILSTKVFWPTSRIETPDIAPDPNDKGLSRTRIKRQIEFSLRNLRTDYLDAYFCHMWDPHTPVEQIVGPMDGLIRPGKVRLWGPSNWPHRGINQACRIAARRAQHPPTLDQPGYNLLDRHIERWLLPTIARRGLSLTTHSP